MLVNHNCSSSEQVSEFLRAGVVFRHRDSRAQDSPFGGRLHNIWYNRDSGEYLCQYSWDGSIHRVQGLWDYWRQWEIVIDGAEPEDSISSTIVQVPVGVSNTVARVWMRAENAVFYHRNKLMYYSRPDDTFLKVSGPRFSIREPLTRETMSDVGEWLLCLKVHTQRGERRE